MADEYLVVEYFRLRKSRISNSIRDIIIKLSLEQVKDLLPQLTLRGTAYMLLNSHVRGDAELMTKCLKAYVKISDPVIDDSSGVTVPDEVLKKLTPAETVRLIQKVVDPSRRPLMRFNTDTALQRALPVILGQPDELADIQEKLKIMKMTEGRMLIKDMLMEWKWGVDDRRQGRTENIRSIIDDSRLNSTQKALLIEWYFTNDYWAARRTRYLDVEENYKELKDVLPLLIDQAA